MERLKGIGGRNAIPIEYRKVSFKDAAYVVGTIQKRDGSSVQFVIDAEDEEKVASRSWHVAVDGSYIASAFTTEDKKRKSLYLHNFVMDRRSFDGKGCYTFVDHINGNGLDNRKVNLRIADQSLQNINTKSRVRKTDKLPPEIDPTTIPRNIWYMPAAGGHGDRFVVSIKGVPGIDEIEWKSSSSKSMSSKDKLEQAIQKRAEFFETYPILKEFSRTSEVALELQTEFNNIISLG
jgi:hypothetical protein